ncbi:MAG: hypothetical protein AAB383_01480 [Patescibacteria group bacterium]
MLLITKYIAKHELAPLSRFIDLEDILDGAKKALKGLVTEVKAPSNARGFRFFKVRVGKRNGARMIVFLVTESQKVVPALIRLKKDKVFGMNMAMNNSEVLGQLNKNMDRILEDIEHKEYEEFPFSKT